MREEPTLFRELTVTARKQHKCCECCEAINKGERYQKSKGLWDGHFMEFKTCLPCARTRTRICAALGRYDEWPAFGSLREYIADA